MSVVVSLRDYSGNMVKPWADAGHECYTIGLRPNHQPHPGVEHIVCDVHKLRRVKSADIIFAFPPCTHIAVSGARRFKSKGPRAAAEVFGVLAACLEYIEAFDCPWMVENPISTFSTYWRKPDHTFQPWQYGDGYDKNMHRMPPGPERQHLRSVTPMGFAQAVFDANA